VTKKSVLSICLILAAMFVPHARGIAATSAVMIQRAGSVADRSAVARTNTPEAPSHGAIAAGSVDRETGFDLFDDAVRLIRDHYPRKPSDRDVFQEPLEQLTFVLLPHLVEDSVSVRQCDGRPEECFAQAVSAIARRSNAPPDRLVETLLKHLLAGLDPNSCLLDEGMLKELSISTSGKFGGVGMVVAPKQGEYVVISAFDGSPAFKAGIRAGNRIVRIDNRSLARLPLLDVLRMVRGPAGSHITVTVKDDSGELHNVRMRRRVIVIPPVRFAALSSEIAYLRIVNFQANTGEEVTKALQRLQSKRFAGTKGIVLDLRDNPGGLFDQAIRVANLFISSGVITSLRGRDPAMNREFSATPESTFPALAMVVLINKGTASAAEILAGALQGRPNVLVMGTRSFGKASVQAVFPLRKGMALRLTTAHYYTADGRDIDGKGLEPDIEIDSPEGLTKAKIGLFKPEELARDPEIERAVDYLKRGALTWRSPFPTWY